MIIGIYIQILIFLFVKPEINYSNFEGIVEYQIIYPDQGGSISPGVPQKFVIYFKNGNIRKEYRDLHDSLIFYSIYLFKENTSYGYTPANDTVLFYKPSSESIDVKNISGPKGKIKAPPITILCYKCDKYDIQVGYKDMTKEPQINYTYYVASQLSIDKRYLSGDGSNFIFTYNKATGVPVQTVRSPHGLVRKPVKPCDYI